MERQALAAKVGQDLSLSSVVSAMLVESTNWAATVDFCEKVVVQKETAERERERNDPSRRRRRRGGGANRANPLTLEPGS